VLLLLLLYQPELILSIKRMKLMLLLLLLYQFELLPLSMKLMIEANDNEADESISDV